MEGWGSPSPDQLQRPNINVTLIVSRKPWNCAATDSPQLIYLFPSRTHMQPKITAGSVCVYVCVSKLQITLVYILMCDWSDGWSLIQIPIKVRQHQSRVIGSPRPPSPQIPHPLHLSFYSTATSCLKPSVTFQARRELLLLMAAAAGEAHRQERRWEGRKEVIFPRGDGRGSQMEEAGATLFFIQHLHFMLFPGDFTQWCEGDEEEEHKEGEEEEEKGEEGGAAVSWSAFSDQAAVKLVLRLQHKFITTHKMNVNQAAFHNQKPDFSPYVHTHRHTYKKYFPNVFTMCCLTKRFPSWSLATTNSL